METYKFSFHEVKSKLLRITLPCFFLMQHNPPNICELWLNAEVSFFKKREGRLRGEFSGANLSACALIIGCIFNYVCVCVCARAHKGEWLKGKERFLPSGLVISDIHPECSQKGNFPLRLQSGEGDPGEGNRQWIWFSFFYAFFSFCKLCNISFISCRQWCLFLNISNS